MPSWLAKTLVLLLIAAGIAWTVFARLKWGEEYTTSHWMNWLRMQCWVIGAGIIILAIHLLHDAIPNENRWFVTAVFVGAFALGHALWPL